MNIVADSEEKLCQFVEEFGRVCRRNLRVNGNKSNEIHKRGWW